MADGTKIEWTEATANVVNGCSLASPGCTNCYAMRMAGTRLRNHPTRAGLTRPSKAGPVWTGEVRFHEPALKEVLRWKRPRRIFWNAHGDLFHDNVPDEWIDRCFAVMALTPHHTHQVLTKRSARMREYLSTRAGDWMIRWPDANPAGSLPVTRQYQRLAMAGGTRPPFVTFPLPNVWLGVSVEDQARADERIPDLLTTPAAVRWLSCEPLLGAVDLNRVHETFDGGLGHSWESCLNGKRFSEWGGDGDGGDIDGFPRIDWIVVGGESGPGARPMHPDWARSLRDQCADAGVPFFFKQWGDWLPVFEQPWNAIAAKRCPDPAAQSPFDHVVWGGNQWDTMNGCWDDGDSWYVAPSYSEPEQELARVGKRAAGRLLDGVLHDGYPVHHGYIDGGAA